MCTLIVLHRCFEAAPLVVAANRDEFFERPAEGPALRETPYGRVLAPRDVRAGGTWLGLNAQGLFVAITNRRCESPDPNRRSRGLIVVDSLKAESAREAAKEIESLETDAYNPFNLLVADRATAHLFSYAGAPERFDLAPGAHVIGNVHPRDEPSRKLARLRGEVAPLSGGSPEAALEGLRSVCGSHEGASAFEHTCVHAGEYGTRSSLLMRLGGEGHELHYADGAPCERAYIDSTRLLDELAPASRTEAHDSARKVS